MMMAPGPRLTKDARLLPGAKLGLSDYVLQSYKSVGTHSICSQALSYVTALPPPLCFIFNLNEMFCFSCYLPVINLIGNSVSGHGLRICVELQSTLVVCPICPGVTNNQPFMFYILKDIFELINKDGVKAQVCVVPTW